MSLEQSIQNLADSMNRVAAALEGKQGILPLANAPTDTALAEAPKKTRASKTAVAATTEAAPAPAPTEVTTPAASTPAPQEETKTSEITVLSLKEIGQKVCTAGKKPDLIALLKKFSAESITKLDPKHYAAFKPELEKLAA